MPEIIFFTTQEEFGQWLNSNCESSELWVGYHKKHTKRASLTWPSSVDAALSYGWIDGIRKTIDDQSYKIRFTPRKTTSVWSAVNVNKVEALIQLGRMKPAGLLLYENRKDTQGYSVADRNVQLSVKYEQQVKENELAWLHFNSLAPSYKRDTTWWVMSAVKEETRTRRLGVLIASSEAGLKIPHLRKK